MSQKRHQQDGNTSDDKRQKLPSLKNVVLEVMKLNAVQNFLEPVLEPLIRKVVKEELELSFKKYVANMMRNIGKEIQPSESRTLQLQFMNTISLPVFTGARIEGEESNALKVALFDELTREIVCFGNESSSKVEIVVLEGDFDGGERNNWTRDDFKNNIVREREGKKPLISGESVFSLEDGICLVGDFLFTDNSSWTRSRKFRVGARVVDNCDEIRIKEAITDAFVVRDHRGELYKKHHPPSLHDEVWRLEKIGKEGAFHKRLAKASINSVQDFLTLLFLDPIQLRTILGTGMSNKMWEVTMEHSKTCIIGKNKYLYPPSNQQTMCVVFNLVGQVMGLFSNDLYIPTDKLSEQQKADAHILVISAYKDWTNVVPFEDDSTFKKCSSPDLGFTSNSPSISQNMDTFNYAEFNTPSPFPMDCVEDYRSNIIDLMDVRFDESLSFAGQLASSLVCDSNSVTQIGFNENEHHPNYFNNMTIPNSAISEADLESAVSGFMMTNVAATKKAQRRWTVLFRVLRWSSMLRKLVRRTHLKNKLRFY